jgi:putative methionine-R-sulfoxide reductase with GAF domain
MVVLFELARGLRGESDLEHVCDDIFAHLRRLVPASLCVFYVYEVDSDDLVAAYVSGDSAPLISGMRIGIGQRVSGWVAAHRQPIRNSDPSLDLGTVARVMPARPKSALSAPVVEEATLVGVLTLYSTHAAAFTEEHQRILQAVAGQVARPLKDAADRARARRGVAGGTFTGAGTLGRGAETTTTSVIFVTPVGNGPSRDARVMSTSLQAARDVLGACLRDGDDVIELTDGLAVILPHADFTSADMTCRRMKELLASRYPGVRLETVIVTSPQDGGSVGDLVDRARSLISPPSHPDSIH